MVRAIYITYAFIVDANGTWNNLSGYPKSRDSVTLDNDLDVTLARANKDNADAWSNINNTDTRQIGTVFTVDISGIMIIPPKSRGALAELPDPEPEPDPEPVEAEAE